MNVVAVQQVPESAFFVHHFREAGSQAGHDVGDRMFVLVTKEDVAASEMWQETEDGQMDGFRFLQGNVLGFVLWFPETACFVSTV
jgi:hypothetical protein